MNNTPRFGFTILDKDTDQLDANNNKFGDFDRVLLDQLLAYAIENHVHNGEVLASTPPPGPSCSMRTTGGVLPPNATLYYKTAIVDDRGQFEMASQPSIVHTAAQAPSPGPPRLVPTAGGLLGGNYAYALSAYSGAVSQETLASTTVTGNLAGGGGWVLYLPSLPSGANGFNVYRRGPSDTELAYLTSVDGTAPFVDTGADAPDIRHLLPTRNTTFTTNAVSLTWEAPVDSTTRIYRTTTPTNWDNSLVDWVAGDNYFDVGRATRPGAPPLASSGMGGAPKIRLGIDTTGGIPSAFTAAHEVVTIRVDGPVTEGINPELWVSEYGAAQIDWVRAHLDIDSVPDAQQVIVSLQRLRATESPLWYPLGIVAFIDPGDTIGEYLEITAFNAGVLGPRVFPGEAMRIEVTQTGEGANTDTGVVLEVGMTVVDGTSDTYTWETT